MKRILPTIGIAWLCAASAGAAVIASDDFESYTAGAQLNGQSGGTGWGGNWSSASRADDVTIISSTLEYTNGVVASNGGGNALQISINPAEGGGVTDGIMRRALGISQTETVYMSLLFNETSNPALGDDFVQWGFSNGTTNPEASIMRRSGMFQVRSTTNSAIPANTQGFTPASPTGVTHLLVL